MVIIKMPLKPLWEFSSTSGVWILNNIRAVDADSLFKTNHSYYWNKWHLTYDTFQPPHLDFIKSFDFFICCNVFLISWKIKKHLQQIKVTDITLIWEVLRCHNMCLCICTEAFIKLSWNQFCVPQWTTIIQNV